MAGGEGQHPAGLGAAAGHLHHHLVEGRHVELIAAEAPRLDDAVEALADQLGVDVVGHAAQRLAVGLSRAEQGTQGDRAFQHLGGRQIGLGRAHLRR